MGDRRLRSVGALFAVGLTTIAILQAASASVAPPDNRPLGAASNIHRPALGPAPAYFGERRGVVGTPNGTLTRAAADALPVVGGIPSPRSVFEPDERILVSPAISAVAFLEVIDQSESSVAECTGTFIAPDVLLTAAHCLYGDELGGWASNIWVTPGMDGYDNEYPFGYDLAENYWVPDEWFDSYAVLWDFGLITMPNGDLGNATGWLEIAILTTESLSTPDFSPLIVGYPGDKAHGTQWAGSKPAFVQVDDYVLYYDIDTYSGQSGSAVLRGSDFAIVGIHVHGSDSVNDATRIEAETLSLLLAGCADLNCQFSYYIEEEPQPPTPTSTSTTSTPDERAFDDVWRTTDQAVAAGQASYSWFWGPQPNEQTNEPYAESPGGERLVRYYDKSRMEITLPDGDPGSIWYVTNGLLTVELVTGRLMTGHASWEQRPAANVPVAGDPTNNSGTPSYSEFSPYATTDGSSHRTPDRTGQEVGQFMSGSGQISTSDSGGVTLAHYSSETGHNIASVFWDWAHDPASGLRPDQGVDWLYVLGYPISEPYWIESTVAGTPRRVLVELFERRALTFTPSNPDQFKVEFGNIGQHYHQWRYGD